MWIRLNRKTRVYRKFDNSLLRQIASKLVQLVLRNRVRSLVVAVACQGSIKELNNTG